LSNRCAIRRVAASGDILDPDGDDVTAAKLAVDRQIEHRKVANSAFDLELRPDRPNVLWSQRWLAPVSLPLFQGTRLWSVGVAITSSCMVILLGYEHRGGWDHRLRHGNQVSSSITADLACRFAECDL
jgi:hypothetical protein